MSGFGNIVGFMFSFFIIVGAFTATFYSYQSQIIENQELNDLFLEDSKSLFYDKFDITSAYILDKRMFLNLENLNSDNIIFSKVDGFNCFSFFVNNKYIPVEKSFISVGGKVIEDYRLIEGNSNAHIILDGNFNTSSDLILKVISCSGIESFFELKASDNNWFNSDWQDRKSFTISNLAVDDIVDYQIRIDLNSSNFDFTKLDEEDIRLHSSASNYLVLGLGLDDASQDQIDYSLYSQVSILGNSTNVDIADASYDVDSGVMNSLIFDGNDYITIAADKSLELSKSLTYSAWIKNSGLGSSIESIFTNGQIDNSISLVNDGGVNDGKVMFKLDISGNVQTIYSNITVDDDVWHFIVATFDGYNMNLYVDNNLVGELNFLGDVVVSSNVNYVGSSDGTGSYFKGNIDEVLIFNIALSGSDLLKLYESRLDSIELDFYIFDSDILNKKLNLYAKIPFIASGKNISLDLFYNVLDSSSLISNSNIENTFTYLVPRRVGFVLNDRISSTGGVQVFSLADNNDILIGNDVLNLDFAKSSNIAAANVEFNDEVYMSKLANVEGNANAVDMMTPISWAGVEFDFRGFRNGADKFCMISPWGDSNVSIKDAGVEEWVGIVNSTGVCVTNDIDTANTLTINSNISILVSYVTAQDPFVFIPAKANTKLYGSPSNSFYLSSGILGANANWYRSDSATLNSVSLGSYGSYSVGGGGADGDAPAYAVWGDNVIGAIQQADGDGTDSTVFAPKSEFSTLFGSVHTPSYVSVVSDVPDAGCILYNTSNAVILNVSTGVGGNDIYKYNFGTGNDVEVLPGSWYLKCEKPVWPYYENTVYDDDETNLFGYLQMKQFIYPEPLVIFN